MEHRKQKNRTQSQKIKSLEKKVYRLETLDSIRSTVVSNVDKRNRALIVKLEEKESNLKNLDEDVKTLYVFSATELKTRELSFSDFNSRLDRISKRLNWYRVVCVIMFVLIILDFILC